MCPECGQLVFNTWRGLLLGLVSIVLIAVSVILLTSFVFKGNRIFVIVPFIAISPVVGFWLFAAWAEPRVIELERRLCEVCHREDVGYFKAGDKVCADCTERLERERVRAIQAERRGQ